MKTKEFEDSFNFSFTMDTDGDFNEEIAKSIFDNDYEDDGEIIDQVQKESFIDDDLQFSFMKSDEDRINEAYSSTDDLDFSFSPKKKLNEESIDDDMYLGSADEDEFDMIEDDALDVEADDAGDAEYELIDDEDGELIDAVQ